MLLSQSRDFYELTENTEWLKLNKFFQNNFFRVKFLEPNATGHFQLIRVSVKKIYTNDADITISSSFDPVNFFSIK